MHAKDCSAAMRGCLPAGEMRDEVRQGWAGCWQKLGFGFLRTAGASDAELARLERVGGCSPVSRVSELESWRAVEDQRGRGQTYRCPTTARRRKHEGRDVETAAHLRERDFSRPTVNLAERLCSPPAGTGLVYI